MVEKIVTLFERLVVALETIAAGSTQPSRSYGSEQQSDDNATSSCTETVTDIIRESLTESELDSTGRLWDPRIDSSGKTQYKSGAKKGQWIRKKNIPDDIYDSIVAELTGTDTELNAAGTFGQNAPATEPNTTGAPPPPPASEITTFIELVRALENSNIDNAVTDAVVRQVSNGELISLPFLASKPELVPAVAERLGL